MITLKFVNNTPVNPSKRTVWFTQTAVTQERLHGFPRKACLVQGSEEICKAWAVIIKDRSSFPMDVSEEP